MASFGSAPVSRRQLLKQSSVLSALGVAAAANPMTGIAAALAEPAVETLAPSGFPQLTGLEADNLYTALGVRPIVNAHGTFTIITGSRSLPEVKRAMYEASFYFVQLDELMEAVGKEIASLTGAPGAIVTTGCEAAIALATLACTTGANIEQCQALPYVRGKTRVIIPTHSRNPYDFGVRMTGAEIVEVDTPELLREELTAQVAMVYVLSGPASATGAMSIANICTIAREKGVPVFVDAAAEEPLSPNIHIQAGASLVGYSGGKCMRGPQAAGLLLGDATLCRAAWFQASPHHNYGRAYKVGKEEIMGMLAAVRQWYKRDHAGEQRAWQGWLDTIAARVKTLPSVTTEILQPDDLSNKSPRLRIHWDANALKITGTEMVQRLDAGTPRIMVDGGTGSRPGHMASSLTIMPYMMNAGEETIVADAILDGLTKPGSYSDPVVAQGSPAQLGGNWLVTIHYVRGVGVQHFALQQEGNMLTGLQQGEIYTAQLTGTVHGDQVYLHSVMKVSGHAITWEFTGTHLGDTFSGSADMGEYGTVPFKATRA
ncbi:PLP-dependent transferase [Acidipila sp. EB88]|uniref:PLP-dependent transferase n=1 Tax=Acidipila sp. EB88 TaxID=2305226 RepID=UPI000F5F2B45|nr:PLP-dependent transferase [Acidipila sp. EB88]RRA49586.1 Cys/Met metabolism pyridoxal-phosphate-dependent protein [Acidipila sp. EB88]